jgi:hypothetical protein
MIAVKRVLSVSMVASATDRHTGEPIKPLL